LDYEFDCRIFVSGNESWSSKKSPNPQKGSIDKEPSWGRIIMSIIQLTGWTLSYVMDEISIGALNVLFESVHEETNKPTGLFADPNLDLSKLKGLTGLKHTRK